MTFIYKIRHEKIFLIKKLNRFFRKFPNLYETILMAFTKFLTEKINNLHIYSIFPKFKNIKTKFKLFL